MPSIPTFFPDVVAGDLGAAMRDAGCVVVHDLVDRGARDRILGELRPHIEQADPEAGRRVNALYASADGLGYADFYQGSTRRVISLIKKSPGVRELATHRVTSAVCEATLKPNCVSYQVHATAAFVIEPGAGMQVLHREEDPFRFLPMPRPNLVTAGMWAISDFTEANGATRLVPGSHRWPEGRVPSEDQIVAAEMPAGSALFLGRRPAARGGREPLELGPLWGLRVVLGRLGAPGGEPLPGDAARGGARPAETDAGADRLQDAHGARLLGGLLVGSKEPGEPAERPFGWLGARRRDRRTGGDHETTTRLHPDSCSDLRAFAGWPSHGAGAIQG